MTRPPLVIHAEAPPKPHKLRAEAPNQLTGTFFESAREQEQLVETPALSSRPAALRARAFTRDNDLAVLSKRALRVIYTDADIVVIDKPSGILSVPGIYTRFSAATAVSHVFGLADSSDDGEVKKKVDQTIVHRLDESTSGVLVFAKTPEVQKALYAQFRERGTRKVYTAVVRGRLKCLEGEIDLPLSRSGVNPWQSVNTGGGGKPSLTLWRVLSFTRRRSTTGATTTTTTTTTAAKGTSRPGQLQCRQVEKVDDRGECDARVEDDHGEDGDGDGGGGVGGDFWRTRVELVPVSGRSHQLRVHLAAIGHPIVGDDLYGLRHEPEWDNSDDFEGRGGEGSGGQITAPLIVKEMAP
eukprot:CAMPEP_0171922404 /NCGR_PEP_ID=MMETSP0993-20121228/21068_1 /TAXON_ID=483369 /ORGANISM="non described non described, Strain CCMP2098" /LENGTH=353 /DNA_ID=CAMNT_0012560049 /DNA_START=277 /DNA_END=1342 /DNA_ORIENTATION=+